MRGGFAGAQAGDLACEENSIIALALALTEEFAPVAPRDIADPRWNRRKMVHGVVDVTIRFEAIVASAHPVEGDRHHRQMVREKRQGIPRSTDATTQRNA
jgi:hypothetical protein